VDVIDTTFVNNNLVLSLFILYPVTLNGVAVTQSHENYYYRGYVETFLTYGTHIALSHLSNSYWYLNTGDMNLCDSMAEPHTAATNKGFKPR
jgi:hypothetical protein